MRKILFTGGRDYQDRLKVINVLKTLSPLSDLILHGGAAGLDTLVAQEAERLRFYSRAERPKWKELGLSAGPVRNELMIRELLSWTGEKLVVVWPGGKGTKDCSERAIKAGLPILYVGGGDGVGQEE